MRLKKTSILALAAIICLLLLCMPALAEESTAQISGIAWNDKNVDGYNKGESGLSGVCITLETVNDDGTFQPVAEVETGKDGYYLLGSLPAGEYRLTAELPSGYQFTYHGDDSHMLPACGNVSYTPVFSVNANDEVTINIGGTKSASYVSLVAFEDENANGGRMSSEALIRHVQVELQYEYDGIVYSICTGETNKEGALKLDDLSPATYQLAVTLPDGYIFGPLGQKINTFYNCVPPTENGNGVTDPFVLPAKGSVGMGIGVVKTGALEGYVWYDENANGQQDNSEIGFAGLDLTLYSTDLDITRTTVSGENGSYAFENLQEGNYELAAQLPDGVMFAYGDSMFTSASKRTETTDLYISTKATTKVDDIGVMPDTAATLVAYEDLNGNGVYDEDTDVFFDGAVFTASAADGIEHSGTTGAADAGSITLHGVRGGEATLSCQLPEGYVFALSGSDAIFSANVGVSSLSIPQNIQHGQDNVFYALVTKPVSIHGTLFEDTGTSGVYTDGCTFLPGFTVQAVTADGNIMATTTTDAQGEYIFTNLLPGEYTVRLLLNDPYIASDYAGDQEAQHVNAISEQTMDYGQTAFFTLLPGEETIRDAAIFKAGTIDGYVLLNPVYDHSDNNMGGLENVTVYLLDEYGAPVSEYAYDTTDSTGYFYIKGVLPGVYSLSYEMPDGSALEEPVPGSTEWQSESFTIENGAAVHMNEVNAVKTANISGYVLQADGSPLPTGTLLQLIPTTHEAAYETETMANGEYIFMDVLPDHYTMEVTLPEGYMVNHGTSSPVPAALSNVSSVALELAMGTQMQEANIVACQPASLGGNVYFDLNASKSYNEGETAYANLSLTLTSNHGETYTAVTDENGAYAFPQMLPGEYTLTFSLDADCIVSGMGTSEGTAWSVPVTLQDGEMNATLSVGVLRYATISGAVWSMDGKTTGVEGLTIQLEKEGTPVAQTITDAQGNFSFDELYPGVYTFSTTLPEGFSFARAADTQNRQSLILEGDSVPFDVLMGAQLTSCDIGIGAVGSIGDTAWLDENGNGMLDMDEVGMPGILIELYQYGELAASTTTDAYGHYEFVDLFPGVYTMQVTMPEELKATRQQTEFPLVSSILPEADGTTVTVENINVPSGGVNLNYDLGFALRKDNVYPDEMNQVPSTNWLPYSEQ